MKLHSTGILNGYWDDRFGKHAAQTDGNGRSVPFSISDAPAGTKSFAVVLDDMDAIPVCGFTWIHWTLCNLTDTAVPENASAENPTLIQGCTSAHSVASNKTRAQASCYDDMAPPNCDHQYDLTVYALDCTLDLQSGFYLNELKHAMKGHILSHATLSAMYRV